MKKDVMESYWRSNVRLVLAFYSFGFGLIFSRYCLLEFLNQFRFFGYKLGFWFSTQGSIYVCCFNFFYAWCMNKIDEGHGVEEE